VSAIVGNLSACQRFREWTYLAVDLGSLAGEGPATCVSLFNYRR
jgi:hypothetical protein